MYLDKMSKENQKHHKDLVGFLHEYCRMINELVDDIEAAESVLEAAAYTYCLKQRAENFGKLCERNFEMYGIMYQSEQLERLFKTESENK